MWGESYWNVDRRAIELLTAAPWLSERAAKRAAKWLDKEAIEWLGAVPWERAKWGDDPGSLALRDADGELHNEGGPAVIRGNGDMYWYVHGKLECLWPRARRGAGPAVVKDGGRREEWWKGGKRHREGGLPAVVDEGVEEWWEEGERHREGGPAIVRVFRGSPGVSLFDAEGERHIKEGGIGPWNFGIARRTPEGGGLSEVAEHSEGAFEVSELEAEGCKAWYQRGKLHRLDGPAFVYCKDSFALKDWYYEGELHRTDGPARTMITWYEDKRDGTKLRRWTLDMDWYEHGKRHREDGPAMYNRRVGSNVEWGFDRPFDRTSRYWYHHGEKISSEHEESA